MKELFTISYKDHVLHIGWGIFALVALVILLPVIANAQQSITTIDMGDGLYISTDQSGRQATTIDLGGGISTSTVQPGFGQPTFPQPALPPLPPIYVPQPVYNPYR